MNLPDLIRLKFPTAIPLIDYALSDHGDGTPILSKWDEGVLGAFPDDALIAQWQIEVDNQQTNDAIYAQLDALDLKSIRALRTNDTARLENIEAEAVVLRSQLVRTE
jgi:hypothetical protein